MGNEERVADMDEDKEVVLPWAYMRRTMRRCCHGRTWGRTRSYTYDLIFKKKRGGLGGAAAIEVEEESAGGFMWRKECVVVIEDEEKKEDLLMVPCGENEVLLSLKKNKTDLLSRGKKKAVVICREGGDTIMGEKERGADMEEDKEVVLPW
ncbi:hypothetical protein HAX54_029274, partial [Datura stramonium]|nr:hypothetical protein [Datura stramonium]